MSYGIFYPETGDPVNGYGDNVMHGCQTEEEALAAFEDRFEYWLRIKKVGARDIAARLNPLNGVVIVLRAITTNGEPS